MNVLFLTALLTLKACNSPYMQCYFKRFFVLDSSEVIFSFLIKKSRQKAIEMEIAFFHPLVNPEGRTSDHQWVSGNISEVDNENSLSAFNYLDDFNFRFLLSNPSQIFKIDAISLFNGPINMYIFFDSPRKSSDLSISTYLSWKKNWAKSCQFI